MTQRDRIVVSVIAAVAVIAGFWFLALKPKREQVSALGEDISKQEQRLSEAQSRISAGQAARSRFADDYATVARLGKAVPVGDQTPSLLYQLERTADRHGIDFRSLKLRASSAPGAPAPSGGASAKPAVPTASQAAAAVAPPGSAVGPAGFPTMPFNLKFEGTFFGMERFLSALERFTTTTGPNGDVKVSGRLLTVDGFAITESKLSGFPDVKASLLATAYVLPPDEGAFAGATSGGPAGGPSAAGDQAQSGSPEVRPSTATAGGMVP